MNLLVFTQSFLFAGEYWCSAIIFMWLCLKNFVVLLFVTLKHQVFLVSSSKIDTSISDFPSSYSCLHQIQSDFIFNLVVLPYHFVPPITLLSNRVYWYIITSSRVYVILWFTIILTFGSDNPNCLFAFKTCVIWSGGHVCLMFTCGVSLFTTQYYNKITLKWFTSLLFWLTCIHIMHITFYFTL